MAELDDLQAAVTTLTTAASSAQTALTDIAGRLTAIEAAGSGPAPGVLEGLANQINKVAGALSAAAAAGEATP